MGARNARKHTAAQKRMKRRSMRREGQRELAYVDTAIETEAPEYQYSDAQEDASIFDEYDLYALDGLDYQKELAKELNAVLGGYDPLHEQPIMTVARFGELIDHYVTRTGPLSEARRTQMTKRFYEIEQDEHNRKPTFGSMMSLVGVRASALP